MTTSTATATPVGFADLPSGRFATLRARAGSAGTLLAGWRPVAAAQAVLQVPTRLGWSVIAAAAVTGVPGWILAWTELRTIAIFCVLLTVFAAHYTLGRAEFDIRTELEPQWAARGEEAVARIEVVARRRVLAGVLLQIPVSRGGQQIDRPERVLPAMQVDESVTLELHPPTTRRGVVVVGPTRTVRGDPLGLLRRQMAYSAPVELVVNPDTAAIGNLGAGLLRDLEGQATNHRSAADVAFHSLREYLPGDDLRHVHAATSARFGRPMVRQFVDTRTARVSIVVSGSRGDYASEDEFEQALSIGGSFAVRGVDDDQRVAVFAAGLHSPARSRQSRRLVLDVLARAQFTAGPGLVTAAERMQRLNPDTSIAVLVTGAGTGTMALRSAADRFGPDVRTVAVQVDTTAQPDMARARRLLMVTVASLAEFAVAFGKGMP